MDDRKGRAVEPTKELPDLSNRRRPPLVSPLKGIFLSAEQDGETVFFDYITITTKKK